LTKNKTSTHGYRWSAKYRANSTCLCSLGSASYIATDEFCWNIAMWPHNHTLRYQKTDTLYLWQKWQHWIVVYAESNFKNAFIWWRRSSCL